MTLVALGLRLARVTIINDQQGPDERWSARPSKSGAPPLAVHFKRIAMRGDQRKLVSRRDQKLVQSEIGKLVLLIRARFLTSEMEG